MPLEFHLDRTLISMVVLFSLAFGSERVILDFQDSVMVNDTVFTLGQIASVNVPEEIRSTLESTVIGESAPPGFSRFASPEEIIRYDLAPLFPTLVFESKGAERIRIKSDCLILKFGDYRDSLESYLKRTVSWKPEDFRIVFDEKEKEIRCFNKPFQLKISGLSSNYPKGYSSIRISLVQGSRTFQTAVLTQIRISTPVIVARQTIARGDPFSNLNCELKRIDITNYANRCYDSLSQLDGRRAMRTISAGMVIHERMVARIPAIERGEQVELSVSGGPVTVSIAGLARENGSIGDKIWIENRQSRQLVRALVIGKGRVKILTSRGAI